MTQTGQSSPHVAAARGRPRSEKAKAGILEAAGVLLLEHGPDRMSVDAVAERAGVSKATIYRWWASKELLALDALLELWRDRAVPPGAPDTGTLREDLYRRVVVWAHILHAPYARAVAGLVAKARCDPEFGRVYAEQFVAPRIEAARPLLIRAIERGEIPADTDVDAALDMVYGPIYHRLLHGHAPLDEPFIRQVVDTVADALESRVG